MKILLRAGKSPYEPLDPHTAIRRNVTATNIGNMVFQEAVFKALSLPGNDVRPNGFGTAPRIFERWDMLVLPFANQFRPAFGEKLDAMATVVSKSKVPVVVVGIGCQTDLDYGLDNLDVIRGPVKRFVSAVLDHSASIGVRGECTAEYLQRLGFSAVDVIGCPSMFMNGPHLPAPRAISEFDASTKLAVNISAPGSQAAFSTCLDAMGAAIADTVSGYQDVVYIPQENRSIRDLLRERRSRVGEHSGIPESAYRELYSRRAVRAFVDPGPWIRYLESRDFVFGTRLHGNIAGILAGAPIHLIGHDSRTLELARYFGIPHTTTRDLPDRIDARRLYEQSDYTEMYRGHAERFNAYSNFLHRNGIDHVFSDGDGGALFEERMKAVDFPDTITSAPDARERMARESWLRDFEARAAADASFSARLGRVVQRRARTVRG